MLVLCGTLHTKFLEVKHARKKFVACSSQGEQRVGLLDGDGEPGSPGRDSSVGSIQSYTDDEYRLQPSDESVVDNIKVVNLDFVHPSSLELFQCVNCDEYHDH